MIRYLFSLMLSVTLLMADWIVGLEQESATMKLGLAHVAGFVDVPVAAVGLGAQMKAYPFGVELEFSNTLKSTDNRSFWQHEESKSSFEYYALGAYASYQSPLPIGWDLTLYNRAGVVYQQGRMRTQGPAGGYSAYRGNLGLSLGSGLLWQHRPERFFSAEFLWLDSEVTHWLFGYRIGL